MIHVSSCSVCGAPLQFEGRDVVVCTYCNAENRLLQTHVGTDRGLASTSADERAELVDAMRRRMMLANIAASAKKRKPRLLLVTLLLLAPIAVSLVFLVRGARSVVQDVGVHDVGLKVVDDPRHWGSLRPTVVDLGGDAVEDLLGFYRGDPRDPGKEFFAAFDGATLAAKWTLGPYGQYDGDQNNHIVVRGGRALVVAGDATVRIVEIASGKELSTVQLSDKVQAACVPKASTTSVWLQVADNQHVTVDLVSGKSEHAARPADCANLGNDAATVLVVKDGGGVAYAVFANDLKIAGFSGQIVLKTGENVVVIGNKSPGTPLPMLVGGTTAPPANLQAKFLAARDGDKPARDGGKPAAFVFVGGTLSLAWQKVLGPEGPNSEARAEFSPQAAVIAGGVVTCYAAGSSKLRLVRVEAATGKVLWDIVIPGTHSSCDEILATATRVYVVVRGSYLLAFDATTGAEVGLVGSRSDLTR